MPRFQLVPLEEKSAIEQLFDCARMATAVIMGSHSNYHLYGEYRQELFEQVRDETVRNFLEYKVRRHGYCRVSRSGQPLNFADNVLSSCYSVCGTVADRFLKRLTRFNETQDIEPIKFWLGEKDRVPLYLGATETRTRQAKVPIDNMVRGRDRAHAARELYNEYLLECDELGITNKLELGPWLVRNGYGSDDELFFYMESREAREELLRGQARWIADERIAARDAAETDKAWLKKKVYQRNYFRRKRLEARLAKSKEYEKLYGAPEAGKLWVERKGKVFQVKERL